ncbi:hypothetical protein B0T22DRAFT_295142 [Podospora appendiculata]|uniref:Uncharacterized protein n=1 Tax=Podospora appendiculata TaxID=314037 RepID=A0AAE0X1H8_9PEZI|nr:hypothetical protein B0T22DRAFT_295142 [Podospora appendiculata]
MGPETAGMEDQPDRGRSPSPRSSTSSRHSEARSRSSSSGSSSNHDHDATSPTNHDDSTTQHHNSKSTHAPPQPLPQPYSAPSSSSSPSEKGHPFLARLAIPIGLLVGGGITGGTTYALVARVQHLIATASVDGAISKWRAEARSQVYDACYLGCTDCDDPSYAYNACQRTAQLVAADGALCDGTKMWNWADRYPDSCLDAMGQVLMGDRLNAVKQGYRNQLAIIILTVLGGVVGGILAYMLWRRMTTTKAQRHHKKQTPPSSSSSSNKSHRSPARKGRWAVFTAAFLGLFAPKAAAYACTGRDTAWSQPFTSTNTSLALSGVVHGWFSNCYDKQDCHKTCTSVCTTSSSSGTRTCSDKCSQTCTSRTYTDRRPKYYVDAILPGVEACGFRSVDVLGGSPGVEATLLRVGNPELERTNWVRILVSGFNVSRKGETDERVLCLWGLGGR